MADTVLLCDDEVAILRAAEIKLKRAGFDVVCAFDGQEGWEFVQASPPDIIVTDCQMPRMSGVDLVKHVRNSEHAATLPMIMLTAKSYELDRDELIGRWNVAALIDKPFSPRQLAERVRETLDASRRETPAVAV